MPIAKCQVGSGSVTTTGNLVIPLKLTSKATFDLVASVIVKMRPPALRESAGLCAEVRHRVKRLKLTVALRNAARRAPPVRVVTRPGG